MTKRTVPDHNGETKIRRRTKKKMLPAIHPPPNDMMRVDGREHLFLRSPSSPRSFVVTGTVTFVISLRVLRHLPASNKDSANLARSSIHWARSAKPPSSPIRTI